MLITQSQESKEIEERNLKLLECNMVEGILISITREGENDEYYKQLIDSGIPIVFFNRVSSKVNAPKVVIDDYKLAFFATEHLIYNGFKKIYHFEIGDPDFDTPENVKRVIFAQHNVVGDKINK